MYLASVPDGKQVLNTHDPLADKLSGNLNLCANISMDGTTIDPDTEDYFKDPITGERWSPPYRGRISEKPKYSEMFWDSWETKTGHRLEMSVCAQDNEFQECPEPDMVGKDESTECLKVMPPTLLESYMYVMPVNNKWIVNPKTPNGVRNLPEFSMQFTEMFEFLYTDHNNEVEHRWTYKKEAGDFDTNQELTPIGAVKYFRGEGASTGNFRTTGKLMPADAPLARGSFRLGISQHSRDDILKCKTIPDGWPSDVTSLTLLLEKFKPLKVEWNLRSVLGKTYVPEKDLAYYTMASGLRMEPGYGYVFSATVVIKPAYAYDITQVLTLTGWTSSVTQMGAVRYKLPEGQTNMVRYSYSVSFDENQLPSMSSFKMNAKDFIVRIGAICCYGVFGNIVLQIYNWITNKTQRALQDIEDEQESTNLIRTLDEDYLMELLSFCVVVLGLTDMGEAIRKVHSDAKQIGWSTYKKRQELGLVIGGTGFLCLQVLYQASIEAAMNPAMDAKYRAVTAIFKTWWQEREEEQDADLVWQQFWPGLGESTMYRLLTKIMEPEKVQKMMQQ